LVRSDLFLHFFLIVLLLLKTRGCAGFQPRHHK
jgi:hypothetical protein